MLKKLAKYGNSTTLVIDKAILELLNMDEHTIVKLHTDGKSLIITPTNTSAGKVSYDPDEALREASQIIHKNELKKAGVKNNAEYAEKYKESIEPLRQEMNNLSQKHSNVINKLLGIQNDPKYIEALSQINAKYDPVTNAEEYMQEYLKLRSELCPEIAEFDKEMQEIIKKHEPALKK